MKRNLTACVLLAALCIALLCGCVGKEKADLTAVFAQTGKSDCILIYTKSTTIVVDAGYEDNEAVILAMLKREGVKKIDHLILTHFDRDHIGSAPALLRKYNVGQVYLPDYTSDSDEYGALVQALTETGVNAERVREDVTLSLSEGAVVRINPTKLTNLGENDDNDRSLIVSVRWDKFGLLLMGDALKARVQEYMTTDTNSYSVVKLPHHGDYFKKLEEYMRAVQPADGIVCCGEEREVDEKLITMCDDLGIALKRTDMGTIRLEYTSSDGIYRLAQE